MRPCRAGEARRRHGAPVRVATTIWLRPPARGRMPTAENPAVRSMDRSTGVGGQIGDRLGEVAVGLLVRERRADGGDGLLEPQVVAGAPERRGRRVHLKHGQAPTGPQDAGRLAQGRGQVGEVAQGVTTEEAVEGTVDEGQPAPVRLHQGRGGPVGVEHAGAQVGPDDAVAVAQRQAREVAGAAGQVEHQRSFRQCQRGHRAASPRLVEPERHQSVDEVVARRNGVEHGAHARRLLFSGGQRQR